MSIFTARNDIYARLEALERANDARRAAKTEVTVSDPDMLVQLLHLFDVHRGNGGTMDFTLATELLRLFNITNKG